MRESRRCVGEKSGRWGKKLSEEQKNKLSMLMKERWRSGKVTSSTFRPKETKLEKIVRQTLEKININFRRNYWLRSKETTPKEYDFYLPDDHLLIEVDGKYWHSLEKNIKNDMIKNELAATLGYFLIRIPEDKCFEDAIKSVIADWRKKKELCDAKKIEVENQTSI